VHVIVLIIVFIDRVGVVVLIMGRVGVRVFIDWINWIVFID
jgi:hypothetical protein